MKLLADVREEIQFSHSGTLSQMMEHLIICGFVKLHRQWPIKTENPLKQGLYRICDPYLCFYLKNIEPNRFKIEQGYFDDLALAQVPRFDVHMGLTVKNLLLQNRQLLLKSMRIAQANVVLMGRIAKQKPCALKDVRSINWSKLTPKIYSYANLSLSTGNWVLKLLKKFKIGWLD